MILYKSIYVLALTFLVLSCGNGKVQGNAELIESNVFEANPKTSVQLNADYFGGEAEVLTYELNKARYKDVHKGEAILVFVKEDFLTDVQVKNDNYSNENSIPVLKCNYFQRFATGMYDYSIMTSVFTPTFYDTVNHSIKLTCSSQDWCGQTFMQLNNRAQYEVALNSYFESEGDELTKLDKVYQEDELFNLLRMNPQVLPTGDFQILPALNYLRTSHQPMKAYAAKARLENYVVDENATPDLMIYSLEIPVLQRRLNIVFDPKDNNLITEWSEIYPTVFDGELKTTTAKLKARMKTPYWNLNSTRDTHYRDSLQLK